MPTSKFFKTIRDKSKAGLDAVRDLGRPKSTPSGFRAPTACGSTASITDPAVSPAGAGSASTSAIIGTLETPDRVEALLPLGRPGTQEPGGGSSSSGKQLPDRVPQISISEPEQDNGKWLWNI